MYGQYELKSLIDQRREETLREAQSRRLAKQGRLDSQPRGLRHVHLAWRNALPFLHASLVMLALVAVLFAAASCGGTESIADADMASSSSASASPSAAFLGDELLLVAPTHAKCGTSFAGAAG